MYAGVIHELINRLDVTVVLTGTEDERELVERIMGKLRGWKDDANAIPLAGELSFPNLCALIETADLTITNNTGPMHIWQPLKRPSSHSSRSPIHRNSGPWQVPHRLLNHDVPCHICYNRVCPYHHECLTLVSPSMVCNAVVDLLQEIAL